MSLGQVRMRPKANKAISDQNPHFSRPQYGGGGGGSLDFLDRLEQAEARDNDHYNEMEQFRLQTQQKGHRAFQKRAQDGSICYDQGISFGDDSSPQVRKSNSMYQTSNNATNQAMADQHEAAKQRHHEATIRELLLEQGFGEQQIQHEIALWRRDLASGAAAPIPDTMEEAQGGADFAPRPIGQRQRGENGQFLAGGDFEDPFKVRAGRSGTPQKSKPWDITGKEERNGLAAKVGKKANAWDIDDAFKVRGAGAQLGKKSNAWDIDDAFKARGSPPQQQQFGGCGFHAQGVAAGGAARSMPQNDFMAPGTRDANQSSIAGGIFG